MTLGRCPLSIFCSRGPPPCIYQWLQLEYSGSHINGSSAISGVNPLPNLFLAGDEGSLMGMSSGAGLAPQARSSAPRPGSNLLFQVLPLYWRLPESGELRYTSRQLNRTICSHSEGQSLRLGTSPSAASALISPTTPPGIQIRRVFMINTR